MTSIGLRPKPGQGPEGRFGPNWIFGLRAFRQRKEPGTCCTVVTVKHNIPFAEIFEEGGSAKGKPLLWIPFSDAKDAVGVRARRFNLKLFQIKSRKGTPAADHVERQVEIFRCPLSQRAEAVSRPPNRRRGGQQASISMLIGTNDLPARRLSPTRPKGLLARRRVHGLARYFRVCHNSHAPHGK